MFIFPSEYFNFPLVHAGGKTNKQKVKLGEVRTARNFFSGSFDVNKVLSHHVHGEHSLHIHNAKLSGGFQVVANFYLHFYFLCDVFYYLIAACYTWYCGVLGTVLGTFRQK